ncbi:endonuclease V isoform X6 [Brassica rapa]|uniref:endonuclease V isoform X6 n=1 Tax=Brassica campestris TaxID=3711 RepID=UPI00142E5E47|nr:endonuclease V isoform X6 [Brassica rapa]
MCLVFSYYLVFGWVLVLSFSVFRISGKMDGEGASGESSSSNQLENWKKEQDRLKKKLITHDDFSWQGSETLKYVGGVDISFSKDDSSVACACLVVLELPSLRVVHNELSLIRLQVPYVPGFLAFREAPVLLQILEKMRDDHHPFYPQVLMVDGNGILHPRGFGLACHLGVLAHLPTIGVGKNVSCIMWMVWIILRLDGCFSSKKMRIRKLSLW